MKAIEIKREYTRIVSEHLARGWTLEWDDASRGNKATLFLFHEGTEELRCLTVGEESGYGQQLDRLEVRLFEIRNWFSGVLGGLRWEADDEEQILSEVFYKVGDDGLSEWYTRDADEAAAVLETKRLHAKRTFKPYVKRTSLKATDSLIGAMRKVPGFEKANARNLRVAREERDRICGAPYAGYRVELLGRSGNVRAERFYGLGGQR